MTHDEIKKLDDEFIELDRLQFLKKQISTGVLRVAIGLKTGGMIKDFYPSDDIEARDPKSYRIDTKLFKQIVDGINDDIDDQIDVLQWKLTKLKMI